MRRIRPELCKDVYKTDHIHQYPEGTELVYSNETARSAKHANVLPDFDNKVVFFGLQGLCQSLLVELWNDNFFNVERSEIIRRYQRRMDKTLGPNGVGTSHIAALHDLGYLPVRIKALPEGSRVNLRVPFWTIRNTIREFYWLTNDLETQLSAESWIMINSATTAYEYRRLLNRYAIETGSPLEFVPWQGHDFSMRGMQGIWASCLSGAGHLLSFTGSDSLPAMDYLEDYYPDPTDPIIGGSVPATEHSVMCMGGKEDEIETFRRLITRIYPKGIVSIVSDTWDFWKVITDYALVLRYVILARDGKVVFRPDSGDPYKIICGDETAEVNSPQYKGAIQCLWEIFGGTITSMGFKLLDAHVGLIYGDSITLSLAQRILSGLKAKGFASGNVVLGIGSYTYTFTTRDAFGIAVKSTFGRVNGQDREIFKDPVTDTGMKKSARGLLRVEYEDGNFVLYDRQTREQECQGLLAPVFEDGKMLRMETLSEIRNRLLQPTVVEQLVTV